MEEETKQVQDNDQPADQSQQASGTFWRNKKFLMVVGIALGVFIIAMAALYVAPGYWHSADPAALQEGGENGQLEQASADSPDTQVPDDENESSAEVLPQTTRMNRNGEEGSSVRDPFAGPIVLTGLITGGQGQDLAIIETSRATYVVKEGERIDDYWTLKEISSGRVVLEGEGEVFDLFFDAKELRGEAETADIAADEEDVSEEEAEEEIGEEAEDETETTEETNGEENEQ